MSRDNDPLRLFASHVCKTLVMSSFGGFGLGSQVARHLVQQFR